MDVYDLPTTEIQRLDSIASEDIATRVMGSHSPVIFSRPDGDFTFLKKLGLDFFEQFETKVPVQQPESDGVNYFVKYSGIPMRDFVAEIRSGGNLYIGAKEILTERGERSDKDGLGVLAKYLDLPAWIDKRRIHSANLWIGAGNNRTLLHYDPWDGLMFLASGEKEFIMIPPSETSKLFPFSPFDFSSLYKGAVLHSKIRPLNVQRRFQERFRDVKGALRGTVKEGEVIYIPAGYWHFVASTNLNIGVNFFIHFMDRSLHLREPLRTYWIKDNITLWPIRWLYAARSMAAKTYHLIVPRKVAD